MLQGPDGLIACTYYGGGDPFAGYQLFYPHGDTSTITDVNGAIIYNSRYDSLGSAITGGALDYAYTGKWQRPRDFSTNMVQIGVRDYDPGLGRFISADPLKGRTADPQTRNRYEYSLNNPRYYDLNGLYPGEGLVNDAIDWVEEKASDVAYLEGLLPLKPSGYYTEYVHPTPGINGPGAQRIVIGNDGEIFFTRDHYKTFLQIEP